MEVAYWNNPDFRRSTRARVYNENFELVKKESVTEYGISRDLRHDFNAGKLQDSGAISTKVNYRERHKYSEKNEAQLRSASTPIQNRIQKPQNLRSEVYVSATQDEHEMYRQKMHYRLRAVALTEEDFENFIRRDPKELFSSEDSIKLQKLATVIDKDDFKRNYDLTEDQYVKIEQAFDISGKKIEMEKRVEELKASDLGQVPRYSSNRINPN